MEEASTYYCLSSLVMEPNQYSTKFFYGTMIGTGCTQASSGGIEQYRAHCSHNGATESIEKSNVARCKFGIGSATSLGTATVKFPINNVWLKVRIHIFDADVPHLLSLANTDRQKLVFHNLQNILVHVLSTQSVSITRHHGHPFTQ